MKYYRLTILSTATLLSILGSSTVAHGAILFRDNFEGTVNTDIWKLPQFPTPAPDPGESNPTFLGRTQLRLDKLPDVVGGAAQLTLNTFNPKNANLAPGEIPSFFGSEIITKETFTQKDGLAAEASVRIKAPTSGNPIPRGLVASLFFFNSTEDGPKQFLFNEIDFEFLTNTINDVEQGGESGVLTNVFANDSPGAGNKAFVKVDGLDLTQFNTYRIEWLPDEVRWLVNGQEIRSTPAFNTDLTTNTPQVPMNLRLNFWAPQDNFPEAFDGDIQPVSNATDDQTFFYEVTSVQVEQLETDQQETTSVPEPTSLISLILCAGLGWAWKTKKLTVE